MKKNLLIIIALLFISVGIICNEWVIGIIFSSDGVIESISFRIRIFVFEIFLIVIGYYIIKHSGTASFHPKNIFLICISLILISSGILINEWVIAKIFSPFFGIHVYNSSVKIVTWLFDLVVILIGYCIIKYQNRISVKTMSVSFAVLCFSMFISLVSGELFLRVAGYKAWRPDEWNNEKIIPPLVEPGGKFYQTHHSLGYIHLPGEFKVIYPDGYSFKVTHRTDTLRITHPLETYDSYKKDEIWIFGCSFTYGWVLNDNETYAWLLQEKMTDYEIVNFGVGGYGTLHSLIQFQEFLKTRKKPVIVIIAYASFHDERNTFLRSRRKVVAAFNKLGPCIQPYARIDKKGEIIYAMANVEYTPFPLMRYSAFIHLIENSYNNIEDRFYHSHEVSKAIIREFFKIAQENDIKLFVAGITSDSTTSDMLQYCQNQGIMTVDISVDLTRKENTMLPHDGHPSPIADRQYADKLAAFLRNNISHYEK